MPSEQNRRSANVSLVGVAFIGVSASFAAAHTFSFASDSNPDGPIFQGSPSTSNTALFRDGATINLDDFVDIAFRWDADEDGPNAATVINAVMKLSAESFAYSKSNFGGAWIHSYLVKGSYEFRIKDTNELVFRSEFGNAVFTTVSNSEKAWGSSGSLQSSSDTDSGIAFIAGGALSNIDLSLSEDFTFSFTQIQTSGGGHVPINGDGSPEANWKSQGSWSAQAVPAPGAFLVAAAGLGASVGRRRRS